MADEEMEQTSVVDTSQDTQDTSVEKRWNLRKRKPAATAQKDNTPEESEDGSVTPPPSTKKRKTEVKAVGGNRRRSRRAPLVEEEEEEEEEEDRQNKDAEILYDLVLSGSSAIKSVASEWVDRYEKDAEPALLELVQYFVLCCGCKGVVTMEMFQEGDTSAIIRKLTENFAEESSEYPLIGSGPMYKKFKGNFCELLLQLVDQCKHKILYDEYMLDTLIVWLVGLTDSQVRAFRHTSTLACVKLVSALISVANDVSSELDNTQRQYDAERKRQGASKSSTQTPAKLKKFSSRRTELLQKKSQLEETMRGLVTSVFVHRYRDSRPEIRALCITELGHWLTNYSSYFLEDMYLKYIGWVIHDKNHEVRTASLKVLQTLYSSDTTAPHMELFTERFKERMLSMRLDADDNTAMIAIHVLDSLMKLDMLEPEECTEVAELVFFECRPVSSAAGKFASDYLFSEEFMARARQTKVAQNRRKPTNAEIMLFELVKFFLEVSIHKHAIYFVDSLWEYVPVLKEWDTMTTLLLDDKIGIDISSQEEGMLIEIMNVAIKRSVSTAHPSGRGKARLMSAKDKKIIEENREKFSASLMVTLPQLMTKFGSDAASASNLVEILQYFDLEVFAELRLQKHLEALMKRLEVLVLAHREPEFLVECSKTYSYLTDSEFSLHSTTTLALQQLVDQLAADLQHHFEQCKNNMGDPEEVEELQGVMVRLAHLTLFNNITRWDIVDEVHSVVQAGLSGECSDSLLRWAVVFMRVEMMWFFTKINKDNPEREALRKLKTKVKRLLDDCTEIINDGGEHSSREAFVTICDTLIVFNANLRNAEKLAGLVVSAEPGLQETLQRYVMSKVLLSEEEEDEPEAEEGGDGEEAASEGATLAQAARLNDHRLLLAGFLKLGMYSAVDMCVLAPVYTQYLRQFPDFGDLLKTSLSRCRESDPTGWGRMVVKCLTKVFEELVVDGSIDPRTPEWGDLRDLARRLSLTTGFDPNKAKPALQAVHKAGIAFAFSNKGDDPMAAPPNLDFLLVLTEFAPRLVMDDKRALVRMAASNVPEGHLEKVKGLSKWDSFRNYCNNLLPRDDAGRGRLRVATTAVAVTGFRGKRRGGTVGEDSWLSARPPKAARLNSSSSDVGSEVSGTSPVTKTTKAKGK